MLGDRLIRCGEGLAEAEGMGRSAMRAQMRQARGRLLHARPMAGRHPPEHHVRLLYLGERAAPPRFDPAFFLYGEDVELGWRLRTHPEAVLYVPAARVRHEGSASSVVGSDFYETHMVAGHWLLADRLANGGVDRSLLRIARIPALVLRAIVRSLRFRRMAPVVALWRGWRLQMTRSTPLRLITRQYSQRGFTDACTFIRSS